MPVRDDSKDESDADEATQIDQPMGGDYTGSHSLSRLALPPWNEEELEDDDELTDYALTIEPSTPPAHAKDGATTTLLPRQPLPEALSFRKNTGSTPPPRRVQADEKRSVTLRRPAPMLSPDPAPALPPLPLASYPRLPQQVAPAPLRRSRLAVLAFVIAGIVLGALAGFLSALHFAN